MSPDINRPYSRARQFNAGVTYDEARMSMWDDGWEVMVGVGVGVEGEIKRRRIFISRKGILTMNRYK